MKQRVQNSRFVLPWAMFFCLMSLTCVQIASAQDDSIFVGPTGDVGMGTNAPIEAFHIKRVGSNTRILIETDDRNATFRMIASGGRDWVGGLTGIPDEFRITRIGSGVTEMII